MKKIKIEIKNRWTGKILFEYEKENNTIKETLQEAVKDGANLDGANLRGAYLSKENVNKIKSLRQIIPEEGSFIAWKKIGEECVAKIEIPVKAKRTCNIKSPMERYLFTIQPFIFYNV